MRDKKKVLFLIVAAGLWLVTGMFYGMMLYETKGKTGVLFFLWCGIAFGITVWSGIHLAGSRDDQKKRKAADIDTLTGVPNRNYFKAAYGEQSMFNTMRYKTIAVYDIDSFKEANDTMDGDDILRMVTESAKKTFGEQGEIFRWGGDEFMVLMEWSMEFAYEICKEFCREVEKDGRVTVSVGVAEIKLSDTIKKNYYRAVQGCYLVKEMGGNSVKRN